MSVTRWRDFVHAFDAHFVSPSSTFDVSSSSAVSSSGLRVLLANVHRLCVCAVDHNAQDQDGAAAADAGGFGNVLVSLLSGGSGSGKSHLIATLQTLFADQPRIQFVTINAPQLYSPYEGDSHSLLQSVFHHKCACVATANNADGAASGEFASTQCQCTTVVCIDDIEGLLPASSSGMSASSSSESDGTAADVSQNGSRLQRRLSNLLLSLLYECRLPYARPGAHVRFARRVCVLLAGNVDASSPASSARALLGNVVDLYVHLDAAALSAATRVRLLQQFTRHVHIDDRDACLQAVAARTVGSLPNDVRGLVTEAFLAAYKRHNPTATDDAATSSASAISSPDSSSLHLSLVDFITALDRFRPANFHELAYHLPKSTADGAAPSSLAPVAHLHDSPHFSLLYGFDGLLNELHYGLYYPLHYPHLAEHVFARMGAQRAKGVLINGPSGYGKTAFAHALARACAGTSTGSGALHVMHVDATSLISKVVGASERSIARLFARAKQSAPTMILIDHIHMLTARRTNYTRFDGASTVGDSEVPSTSTDATTVPAEWLSQLNTYEPSVYDRILTCFLLELDGLPTKAAEHSTTSSDTVNPIHPNVQSSYASSPSAPATTSSSPNNVASSSLFNNQYVVLVGVTPSVSLLDPAMLRPGRFDVHLTVPRLSLTHRFLLFVTHTRAFALRVLPEHAPLRAMHPLDSREPHFAKKFPNYNPQAQCASQSAEALAGCACERCVHTFLHYLAEQSISGFLIAKDSPFVEIAATRTSAAAPSSFLHEARCSPADIVNICREAALAALAQDVHAASVNSGHLLAAFKNACANAQTHMQHATAAKPLFNSSFRPKAP